MYKVLLVRHGESIWNHSSKFTGWTNIPLTKNGKQDAKRIAQTLKTYNLIPEVFFSSVLTRAIDTTNIIKNDISKNAPFFTSWRLNEKHYGTLEGVPRKYMREEYGNKFTNVLRNNFYMKPPVIKDEHKISTKYKVFKNCYYKSIKNGESKENVLDRALPYFENDILSSLDDQKIPLVVTHKHCMRVIMKHYLNINDEEFETYTIPSNSIVVMNFDNNNTFTNHSLIEYV